MDPRWDFYGDPSVASSGGGVPVPGPAPATGGRDEEESTPRNSVPASW